MQASVRDLIRLGYTTEGEASEDLGGVARRLQKEGILRRFHRAKLVFELQRTESGACVFLSEAGRCTVYADRPEICRQFPKIGPHPGSCPYQRKASS